MARIRSIHPGLFTDEAYMGLSMTAKAALPGIWTECDDGGVFEWKPLGLKARLFPVDSVNMPEVLDELTAANFLMVIDVEGKRYGLVRNFRKWQRPEKPKHRHPLPDEHRKYVGLAAVDPQPIPDLSPTDPGKSPQREEGGGMMKEEGEGEKEHRALARAMLSHEVFMMSQWERDFLTNVSELPEITPTQVNSLAAITARFNAMLTTTPPEEPVRFDAGQPQFEAWLAEYERQGKPTTFYRTKGYIVVPTEWPPGHETDDLTPPDFLNRRKGRAA